MHRAERTHHSPLFDSYMPAERRTIHQHAMVADHAVMADMSIGHDQSIVANAGETAALHRTAADGNALANLVVVANLQTRWFPSVGNILRRHADRAEGKEGVVGSNFGRP